MININGIIVKSKEELEKVIANLPEAQKEILRNEFDGRPNVKKQSASEKDYNKYLKRAAAKDKIIAEMATENMERVRAGKWSVPDLVELTQNTDLKLVLDDISTLSFELAATKLSSIRHRLLTEDIRKGWIAKLQANYYNE
jgi:hypothetical protein